jgi:hypothetical protein
MRVFWAPIVIFKLVDTFYVFWYTFYVFWYKVKIVLFIENCAVRHIFCTRARAINCTPWY